MLADKGVNAKPSRVNRQSEIEHEGSGQARDADERPIELVQAVPGGPRQVRHPVPWSIPASADEQRESLPLLADEDDGPLYPDRWNDKLLWCMPEVGLVHGGPEEPVLVVRKTDHLGHDGEKQYEGELAFAFWVGQPDNLKEEICAREADDYTVQDIPLRLTEVELVLRYRDGDEDCEEIYPGEYDPSVREARFRLKGDALKLAYAQLSSEDLGVEVRIIGDYNAWFVVEGPEDTEDARAKLRLPRRIFVGIGRGISDYIAPGISERIREQLFSIPEAAGVKHAGHGRVNINAASYEELQEILHIGPARAVKIIELREEEPFASVVELERVSGIGPVRVADIKEQELAFAEADDRIFTRQRMVFERSFVQVVSCQDYQRRYQIEDSNGGTRSSFGCKPPWKGSFCPGPRYRKLSLSQLEIPKAVRSWVREVYIDEDVVQRFLIVPSAYVLARTGDDAAPALSMASILSPIQDGTTKILFVVAVAPELLPCHRAMLRAALFKYLNPRFDADGSDAFESPPLPDVRFPTDLPRGPEVAWDDTLTVLVNHIVDGDSVVLTAQARSPAKASLVVEQIKQAHLPPAGLSGVLGFTLDNRQDHRQQQEVGANVNLHHTTLTTGSALDVVRDNGSDHVRLVNNTPSPVTLLNLVYLRAGGRAADMEPPPDGKCTLAAGESLSLRIPSRTEEVLADDRVEVCTEQSLTRLLVDVGMMHSELVVESDVQAHETFGKGDVEHSLLAVSFEIRVEYSRNVRETLRRTNDGFERVIVEVSAPLDRYLAPDLCVLEYQATFEFSSQETLESDWREHNYRNNPRLTLGRVLLQELLKNRG